MLEGCNIFLFCILIFIFIRSKAFLKLGPVRQYVKFSMVHFYINIKYSLICRFKKYRWIILILISTNTSNSRKAV